MTEGEYRQIVQSIKGWIGEHPAEDFYWFVAYDNGREIKLRVALKPEVEVWEKTTDRVGGRLYTCHHGHEFAERDGRL